MSPPAGASGQKTSPFVSLLSGLSSGLLSTLLLQPLDVAKTSLINPARRSSGMLHLFRDIRGEAGWTGMWRGVGPALARIAVGSSIYFTTQTQMLEIIRAQMREEGHVENAQLSSQALLLAGFVSRATAVSVCCPISVVKTRIEGNMVRPYSGLLDGLSTIWRVEGVRGLYTGLLPSVLKDSPYSAVYLLFYSRLKNALVTAEQQLHWLTPLGSPMTAANLAQLPAIQFTAAFVAGGVATTLFQPTEVIKTRLQLDTQTLARAHGAPAAAAAAAASSTAALPGSAAAAAASAAPLPSTRHRVLLMTRRVYAEDGMPGFFRGLAPRVIKRSLSNAFGWMIFEQLVQFWSGTTGL